MSPKSTFILMTLFCASSSVSLADQGDQQGYYLGILHSIQKEAVYKRCTYALSCELNSASYQRDIRTVSPDLADAPDWIFRTRNTFAARYNEDGAVIGYLPRSSDCGLNPPYIYNNVLRFKDCPEQQKFIYNALEDTLRAQ